MVSKAEWKRRVEAYRNSGMSQPAWCRSEGISISTFKYHLQKSTPPKFVELKTASRGIKILWKTLAFEIDPDFDEKTLSRFLSALR